MVLPSRLRQRIAGRFPLMALLSAPRPLERKSCRRAPLAAPPKTQFACISYYFLVALFCHTGFISAIGIYPKHEPFSREVLVGVAASLLPGAALCQRFGLLRFVTYDERGSVGSLQILLLKVRRFRHTDDAGDFNLGRGLLTSAVAFLILKWSLLRAYLGVG
jgi:hypothetical protein